MRIIIISLACLLSACSLFTPYKPDIQQGNVITKDMVSQLHLGMTQEQTSNIMGGQPVLRDAFAGGLESYVYTMKPGKGKLSEKKLILTFKNNKLVNIQQKM